MSEGRGGDSIGDLPANLPEAVLRDVNGPGISLVWLIPILAVLIGGWIAWRAISEQGPIVTIEFQSAEGIEAGQTKVAYKDLQVGNVTSIVLSEDLSHVIVTAELTPGAEAYLTENTRFWVVRPQISAGRVTGLGTLLSGSFIAVDPDTTGESQSHFIGLETAPIVTRSQEGRVFTLRSRELGSVDVGAPVTYRQIQVGEVAAFEMDPTGQFITTQVFVRSPHDERVRENTRFWNASGLDVTVNAEGIRVRTGSLVSMLIGGIAFDTPDPSDPGDEVGLEWVFPLFASQAESEQPVYSVKRRYLLHFPHSVQGLTAESPVIFRGIRIGRVLDVRLELDATSYEVRVPVLIEFEPERLSITGSEPGSPEQALGLVERLVANGLRARLGRGNLLTGGLQVEFDLFPDEPEQSIVLGGRYPELPTIPAPLDEITSSVSGVVAKIDRLPLDQIGRDLQGSLSELRKMLIETNKLASGLNQELIPSMQSTLSNLDRTVASLSGMLAEDAPLPIELRRALEDVGEAARSVRVLADYLEQHPEALIRGK
jgi:paraquat-inducible protein B